MLKYVYILILLLLGCELSTSTLVDDDTIDPNSYFSYNISSKVAFYFFESVLIDENLLSSEDWVGAFNGEICVGAKKWDTSQCSNGICEITIMGDDGEIYSDGYMNEGQFPSFKVYDYSDNQYYDATPSSNQSFANTGSGQI